MGLHCGGQPGAQVQHHRRKAHHDPGHVPPAAAQPTVAPDAISIALFGPGVIVVTAANPTIRSAHPTAPPVLRSSHAGTRALVDVRNPCDADGAYVQEMPIMDAIDDKILRILRKDGRITHQALAERSVCPPPPASGGSRRWSGRASSPAIAPCWAMPRDSRFAAFVLVGLGRHTARVQQAFEARCAAAPQVVECHNITGTANICCASNAAILPLQAVPPRGAGRLS